MLLYEIPISERLIVSANTRMRRPQSPPPPAPRTTTTRKELNVQCSQCDRKLQLRRVESAQQQSFCVLLQVRRRDDAS